MTGLLPSLVHLNMKVCAPSRYAFPHPQTYIESGWVTQREDDAELLGALLTALQEVYKGNDEARTMMPSTLERVEFLRRQKAGSKDIFTSVKPFKEDEALGERTRERLHQWQVEYARGLIDSGLADWLKRRPLVTVVGDALVLHGGLPLALLQRVAEQQRKQLELEGGGAEGDLAAALDAAANQAFFRSWQRLGDEDANPGTNGFNPEGLLSCYPYRDCHDPTLSTDLISEIVQSRGYFDPTTGCDEVTAVLDLLAPHTGTGEKVEAASLLRELAASLSQLQAVKRIVVGHTPGDNVRESCDGKLLAVDASLSRHYRAYLLRGTILSSASRPTVFGVYLSTFFFS